MRMLTSNDLSGWLRFLFIPLLGLIAFLLTIFVNIPNGDLIYCIAGLAIFSVYTVVDFNLIRRPWAIRSARSPSPRASSTSSTSSSSCSRSWAAASPTRA